jgi:hypothetical protein
MKEISLHPMTFREIIFLSFRVFFRNYWTLFGLALILSSPIYVANYLDVIVKIHNRTIPVVLSLTGLISIFYYYAVSTLIVSYTLNHNKAGILQIMRVLRGRLLLKLLATSILMYFTLVIIAGTFFAIAFAIMHLSRIIVIMIILSGIVALGIVLIYLLFFPPCIIIENVAYIKALKRSWSLVQGHWWRIVGRLTLMILLAALFYILTLFILVIAAFAIVSLIKGASPALAKHYAKHIGYWVATIGLPNAVLPFFTVFPVLLYYDIRIRKEALGMESIRELVASLA